MTKEEYIEKMNQDEEWAPGWLAIKEDYNNIQVLIDLMKKDNPELITDMNRTISYL